MTYIESDCTLSHEGHSYTAAGAVVASDFAIAYLVRDKDTSTLQLTDWHGKVLSERVTITSSWRIHSYLSDRMYQVEAYLNDVLFTGRTCGVGMIWRGRAKRGR